jgi:hypothetical protein
MVYKGNSKYSQCEVVHQSRHPIFLPVLCSAVKQNMDVIMPGRREHRTSSAAHLQRQKTHGLTTPWCDRGGGRGDDVLLAFRCLIFGQTQLDSGR